MLPRNTTLFCGIGTYSTTNSRVVVDQNPVYTPDSSNISNLSSILPMEKKGVRSPVCFILTHGLVPSGSNAILVASNRKGSHDFSWVYPISIHFHSFPFISIHFHPCFCVCPTFLLLKRPIFSEFLPMSSPGGISGCQDLPRSAVRQQKAQWKGTKAGTQNGDLMGFMISK